MRPRNNRAPRTTECPFGRDARRILAAAVSMSVWAVPGVATADEDDPTEQLVGVLDNVRNTIVGIAGTLVVVMLTIAGVRYLLGAGDPSQSEKAKTALMAAVVGFAIVVLAPVLVAIVKGILGAD